jgi:hypothetical protein
VDLLPVQSGKAIYGRTEPKVHAQDQGGSDEPLTA